MTGPARDPWSKLARLTPARIALGRAGASLPTREWLAFALAHAQARDAVHRGFDAAAIKAALTALGLEALEVASEAADRATYLRRPDLGRRLSAASRLALGQLSPAKADIAFVIGDGLSAAAAEAEAVPLITSMRPRLAGLGLSIAPLVIAHGCRVALGDVIGAALGIKAVVVLIGERPGLSSPESLGIYLTFDPKFGRNDAERNCISNVRPAGLSSEAAAFKLAWLIREAFARKLTGVALKDESDLGLTGGRGTMQIPLSPSFTGRGSG